MKKFMRKALASMLMFTMCFSSVNISAFAQNVDEIDTTTEVVIEQTTDDTIEETTSVDEFIAKSETAAETDAEPAATSDYSGWDQTTTEKIFEGENFNVYFTLSSNWDAGYNATIKLENTGDESIQNWSLGFEYTGSITNIWNAEILSNENGYYTIKNVGWNQDIDSGKSIEFGISGNAEFMGFPSEYELIGTSSKVTEEDYTIQYVVDNDWETGFYGSISVKNSTNNALEDWLLEFDFDREITEIWNGVIEQHTGNHYIIRNAGYNSTIDVNEGISIGIKGISGLVEDKPYNYNLYSYTGKKTENIIDLELDSDNDGAPDFIEEYFGTDINRTDTDGDGLSDYIELYSLTLDPLNVDTDNNGINDADEDLDGDGLSNIFEFTYGTSIVKQDSDDDGLSDYDEINEYGTNPLSKDTDEDGASDSKEVELGTNPLVYDDIFSVSLSADEEDTVDVSVDIELSGKQLDSLSIKKFDSEFLFPNSMPGYIGGAYDFYVDGEFNQATIKFEFDETLLQSDNFDPVIYYFNEEKQLLEELETTVIGNVASTVTTHFSKYILLNRKVYQNAFEWQDVWNTTGFSGVEVILVIDDSGSMGWNDRNNQRLTVAKSLVDNLPENSKVGIVRFTGYTSKLTASLTNDKNVAKSYLSTRYFTSSGGTSMYNAISSAFSLFDTSDENILKTMVVLSDGATSDTSKHSSVISTANSKGVKIYTVGLGSGNSSYFIQYLDPLANNTAGAFYLASNASQLEKIYKDINKKIDIETDTDKDGIADYYEDNMVMFNGVTIKLDKNNPDSDNDGIPDGEEVAELNYRYNSDKTQVIVTGKLISNPVEKDTDGDGISDEEEYIIGTDPKDSDTDNDGLTDGFEYSIWYDPLTIDGDGDGRTDLQEYNDGTDPYMYNKDWYDYTLEFIYGFVAGDFIADTDSIATIMGQITSSFIPLIDIRDVAGNLKNGDYAFAGLSAIGLAPAIGDGVKTIGKVGKFAVKNLDDIPKIANLLEFLNKNFPEAVKILNKSDDFIDAAKQLSKAENLKLTKKQAKVITEAFDNAGLSQYLLKTSNSLELDEAIHIGTNIWDEGPLKRGQKIDNLVNGHLTGKALFSGRPLGVNFPVFDRIDGRKLISTKSLDVATSSYQDPKKLQRMLDKYSESMKTFETKYFKGTDTITWANEKLSISDYDQKVLELVFPDVIMTEDSINILNTFKKTMEAEGFEIWYRIAY